MMKRICYLLLDCCDGLVNCGSTMTSHGFHIINVNSFRNHRLLSEKSICHENDYYSKDSIAEIDKEITKNASKMEIVIFLGVETSVNNSQSLVQLMPGVRELALQFDRILVLLNEKDIPRLFSGDVDHISGYIASTEALRKELAAKVLERTAQHDVSLAKQLREAQTPSPIVGRGVTVLVVGGGAREHAIVCHLLSSKSVGSVLVVPGNAGTAQEEPGRCRNVDVSPSDTVGLVALAIAQRVALVIVGPEQPLVDGIVDAVHAQGIPCFGPSRLAAQLEASKAFSKAFMARHGIRTARHSVFSDFPSAEAYLRSSPRRVVVKASGLAAGKGVVVPASAEEAVGAARDMLEGRSLGPSGAEIVIEDFVEGTEVSVLAFCDGRTVVPMPPVQDHKRVGDGDAGPNTGGMGAFAPSSAITGGQLDCCVGALRKTVRAMADEGEPFVGVLYGGFILPAAGSAGGSGGGAQEPVMLEYNCRFGDPEAQVLLPLLRGDLYDTCMRCVLRALQPENVQWKESQHAVAVVCASAGYPDSELRVGQPISGLDAVAAVHGAKVYHGATAAVSGNSAVCSSGGRVLSVTGAGATLQQAAAHAYSGVASIHFDGMHFRSDIASAALRRETAAETRVLRVAVLGSTRGTSLQPLLEHLAHGEVSARVVIVVSDKKGSGILEHARSRGVRAEHVSAAGKTREAFDEEVAALLASEGVDLVLMIGYMRIASAPFVRQWGDRMLNVHPSLLPAFAGLMDTAVHEAVLGAGVAVTGCTVHYVSEEVDRGEIAVQLTCPVDRRPGAETAGSLKAKVQRLEGEALAQAVRRYAEERWPGRPVAAWREVTYRDAGVDIDAGEALVERIKPLARATRRIGCLDASLGGFGGLFDLSHCERYRGGPDRDFETVLVAGTDGVGTKLLVAQAAGDHSGIGIDLVAMCVNDVLVCGAEPLFFLDYYATGRLHLDTAAAVVASVAEGCRQAGCALLGGETAEMSGMYAGPAGGEYDVAGFAVGAVRRSEMLPRGLAEGDVVLGLRSSGLHSNGFSLVRRCVELSGVGLSDPAPFVVDGLHPGDEQPTLGQALLAPTTIYVSQLLPLVHRGLAKALVHVTGGGLVDNIPRVLPSHLAVGIDVQAARWELPGVFRWVQSVCGLSQAELVRTFNCGVGMVVVVAARDADAVCMELQASSPGSAPPLRLGAVVARGVDGDGSGLAPQVILKGSLF